MTLDLPAEAQARLQAEATRRGITLDQLIADIAAGLPAETAAPKHRLGFVGIGASGRTEPLDIHQERADLAAKEHQQCAALLDERTDLAITTPVAAECSWMIESRLGPRRRSRVRHRDRYR